MLGRPPCRPVFIEYAGFQPPSDNVTHNSARKCADAILSFLKAEGVEGVETVFVLPPGRWAGSNTPVIVMRAQDVEDLMNRLTSLGPLEIFKDKDGSREPAPGMREFTREGHTIADLVLADPDEGQIVVRCGEEILSAIAQKIQRALQPSSSGTEPALKVA